MLRYLAWVLRSIRKDLALRNYIGIWQKTWARFGLICELVGRALQPTPMKLVVLRLGVKLTKTEEAMAAAGCVRHGLLLGDGFESPGVQYEHQAKLAGVIPLSRKTELVVTDGLVHYSVTHQIGRLPLKTRSVTSRFHNPPAAEALVLRELARLRLIDFDSYLKAWLTSLPGQRLDAETPVVLYLPEVGLRNSALSSEPLFAFAGITAEQGWLGCAKSYQALARLAEQTQVQELTVMEDDALLPIGWSGRWQEARAILSSGKTSVVSGLVSDLEELPNNWRVERVGSSEFFVSGHFSSTVFTVFGKPALQWLSNYPSHASDPNTEGLDRFVATMPGIEVAAFVPALVEHDPEARSTLWRFDNRTYRAQIAVAERLMAGAIRAEGAESQTRRAD